MKTEVIKEEKSDVNIVVVREHLRMIVQYAAVPGTHLMARRVTLHTRARFVMEKEGWIVIYAMARATAKDVRGQAKLLATNAMKRER